MRRLATRILVAALLGVAAGPALAGPAHAAACTGGKGVTVVVGSSVGCDADGGGRAADNVAEAGHQLTFAVRSPGFVCRVDGAPASDPCVEASPSDAYWALFWSDGASGEWTYSSLGVTALKVPQGGSVALVFQTSDQRTWPSVAPTVLSPPESARPSTRPSAKPSPKTAPKSSATARPAPARSGATTSPTATASEPTVPPNAVPSTSVTTGPSEQASAAPPASTPSSGSDDSVEATARLVDGDASDESSVATAWAAGALVALLAVAGGVAWIRRHGGR